MIPRAASPVGIVLVDKPAGPSSHALVEELRRRTGARTGHAGTLDPFATGLLLLLSGSSTKLAPCFVGLDKRYVTDVDLTATSSTGDPEGEVAERHEPPGRAELEARLEALRGEIELPIPAASAVKIGGERAYRLQRRGVEVEMPLRRSQVYALDVIAYTGDQVRLGLHVGSGTYVRSIAEALGGHCLTLRRTAVGPFTVEEADPGTARVGRGGARPAAGRGARAGPVRPPRPGARVRVRDGGLTGAAAGSGTEEERVRVARVPAELEPKPRAVAIGTFDGVHLGHQAVVRAGGRGGRHAHRRHVPPAPARGPGLRRPTPLVARAAARAPGGARGRGGARRRVHARDRRHEPRGVRDVARRRARRGGGRGRRGVPLREQAER